MTPQEQAVLDQMSVSQKIEEYRRRAGTLTSAELSQAIALIRKDRQSSAIARGTAKATTAAKSGKSAEQLLSDLDGLA